MTLETVLRNGFAAAHRRLGLIFLDTLWKGIWLVAMLVALVLAGLWFGSSLQSLTWNDTGIPALNAWIATAALRQFWIAHRAEIMWMCISLALVAFFGWLFLEAYFRARILDKCVQGEPDRAKPEVKDTRLFFVSGTAKASILGSLGLMLIPVWHDGAPVLAAVIFAAFAFFLSLLETLIRADAVELLGTDLIRVTGLVGILMSFEAMIGGSLVIILVMGFLRAARLSEMIEMAGLTAVVIVFLNVLHSYLLLVRFSAIDTIMRKNVIEV